MRCTPLVIVPTQTVGTKNPAHKQRQKIKSLVLNLVLNKRFKDGINFLISRLHFRQLERNLVVKYKVTRKKFPRREKTFPLPMTREPLVVSVEKLTGERKHNGPRFRRQVIQQKQPLQEDNVSLSIMLKNNVKKTQLRSTKTKA